MDTRWRHLITGAGGVDLPENLERLRARGQVRGGVTAAVAFDFNTLILVAHEQSFESRAVDINAANFLASGRSRGADSPLA